MFKELLLLIIGGAIAFIFTMLSNRLSKRKPSMVWMALPSVHFAKEGLATLQIYIANEGNAPATNVRVVVKLDNNNKASFDSVEVHPSESAIEFSNPSINPIELLLPRVPSRSNVTVSCIVRSIDEPKPQLSIVGDDDVIGTEMEMLTEEVERNFIKKFKHTQYAASAFFVFLMASILVWTMLQAMSFRDVQQQIEIGNLYMKNKDYEAAQRIYSGVSTRWYEPPRSVMFIKLASVAAAQGKDDAAIELLNQIPSDRWESTVLLLGDSSFDSIRVKPEFKKLIQSKGN